MKKLIILSLSFIMLASTAINAQDSTGRKHDRHDRKKAMKELNLNEEQKSKMKEIGEAQKEKKAAIERNAALTEEQKKTQLKELKMDGAKKVNGVLNDEQKKKMREIRKEKHQGKHEPKRGVTNLPNERKVRG